RRLGAQRPLGLEVLAQRGVLVVQLQRGLGAAGDDPGGEAAGRASRHAASEEEPDLVRAAECERLQQRLLEELASGPRVAEDVCQRALALEDRELVLVAGGA